MTQDLRYSQGARIIYVVESPLSVRDTRRFGLTALRSRGFDVTVWDVTAIYLRGASEQWYISTDDFRQRRFTAESELIEACKELDSRTVIILISGAFSRPGKPYMNFIRSLGRSAAILAAPSANHIPPEPPLRDPASSLARRLTKLAYARLLLSKQTFSQKLMMAKCLPDRGRAFYRPARGLRPLDWVWAGPTIGPIDPALLSKRTRVLTLHSWDYDTLLQLPAPLEDVDRHVVFVDGMGPRHPDYVSLGTGHRAPDTEDYYSAVRRVLDKVEHDNECRVVVAAHPRAEPGVTETALGGRKVVYGQTVEAIASASWVIMAHASTLTGIAAAVHCPVSVICSSRFDPQVQSEVANRIRLMGLGAIDADAQVLPKLLAPSVHQRKYARYVRKYVTPGNAPQGPFWDLVADALLNQDRDPLHQGSRQRDAER